MATDGFLKNFMGTSKTRRDVPTGSSSVSAGQGSVPQGQQLLLQLALDAAQFGLRLPALLGALGLNAQDLIQGLHELLVGVAEGLQVYNGPFGLRAVSMVPALSRSAFCRSRSLVISVTAFWAAVA